MSSGTLYYNDYESSLCCRSDDDWRLRVASTLEATKVSIKRAAEMLEVIKPKDEKPPPGDSPAVHQLRIDIKVLEQEITDAADVQSFVRTRQATATTFSLAQLPVFVHSLAARMDCDGDAINGVTKGWAVYHHLYTTERTRQLGKLRAKLQGMIKPAEVVKCICALEVMLHELEARSKIARVIEADHDGQVERLKRGEPIPIKLRFYSREDTEISHRIHG